MYNQRIKLDINNWKRKDHFNFFKQFNEPFFGITIVIDCTKAYKHCKLNNISFFLFYLHKSLIAANDTEPFRYRIVNEEVFIYDQVNASPTINKPDGTFGFSYMNYYADFEIFYKKAKAEIEEVQNSKRLIPAVSGENVIHYSSIPWLRFTALSHARNFNFADSCPKISFGKVSEINNHMVMPVSIHAHHALMDGYHVGAFADKFQKIMNNIEL